MAFICICPFWKNLKPTDRDDVMQTHQRQQHPGGLSSQSAVLDRLEPRKEALIRQTEMACTSVKARTEAVLNRLKLSTQHDPHPIPQPPAGPEHRPASSVRPWRIKPVSFVPHLEISEETHTSLIQQSNAGIYDADTEALHSESDRSFCVSLSARSEDTLRCVDTRTPCELRAIPLIYTPDEVSLLPTAFTTLPPPPPKTSATQPKRQPSRLPVLIMNLGRAGKEVGGVYGLLTATHQINAILEVLKHPKRSFAAPLQPPPAAPERNPAEAALSRAPSPKPTPSTKKGTAGTTALPGKTANWAEEINTTSKFSVGDSKEDKNLQLLTNPTASLSQCFILLSSDEWIKKVEGLRFVRALAKHHPDTLMVKLHEVCLVVMEEVKNLRSSVACAAINTITSLYVNLKRNMDHEVERTGRALLLRAANAAANTFVQKQLNVSLEALVHSCSPARVLTVLLNIGLCHLSTPVRAITARQLHLLADKMGPTAVLKARQSFTPRFLTAVSKMLLDAASQVRTQGHAIIAELAKHRDFTQLWKQTVPEKDQRLLEKTVRNAALAARLM